MSLIRPAILDHKDLVHQKSMSVCVQLNLWIYSAHVPLGLTMCRRGPEHFGNKKEVSSDVIFDVFIIYCI